MGVVSQALIGCWSGGCAIIVEEISSCDGVDGGACYASGQMDGCCDGGGIPRAVTCYAGG